MIIQNLYVHLCSAWHPAAFILIVASKHNSLLTTKINIKNLLPGKKITKGLLKLFHNHIEQGDVVNQFQSESDATLIS